MFNNPAEGTLLGNTESTGFGDTMSGEAPAFGVLWIVVPCRCFPPRKRAVSRGSSTSATIRNAGSRLLEIYQISLSI
jgi:hypothetical protein